MQNHHMPSPLPSHKHQDSGLEPLLVTIPEVAKCLGLSRATVYVLISKGVLPTVRIGRSVRVSVNALRQFVVERENDAHAM